MLPYLILASLLALVQAGTQEYSMCYLIGDTEPSCMPVQVNADTQSVHYHMAESGVFEDVETLEDYQTGFGASRVESQEACYVRGLPKTFSEQVAYIQEHQHSSMSVEDQEKVSAIPIDNPEEEIGSLLADFCGELPVYKAVQADSVQEVDKRQVAVTFTRCVLFCFIPICYHTTLTLPTGSSVTFVWVFG